MAKSAAYRFKDRGHIERTLSAASITEVTFYDDWRDADRTLRFVGRCYVCRKRTWAADDGENDPRGVLGDHATHALVASEYERVGPDVPLCALCGNDYESYKRALDYAYRAKWTLTVQ